MVQNIQSLTLSEFLYVALCSFASVLPSWMLAVGLPNQLPSYGFYVIVLILLGILAGYLSTKSISSDELYGLGEHIVPGLLATLAISVYLTTWFALLWLPHGIWGMVLSAVVLVIGVALVRPVVSKALSLAAWIPWLVFLAVILIVQLFIGPQYKSNSR